MNEKEFYKRIKLAITISVNRFYRGVVFDTFDEDLLWKKQTIRSIFNEYKRIYPFHEEL